LSVIFQYYHICHIHNTNNERIIAKTNIDSKKMIRIPFESLDFSKIDIFKLNVCENKIDYDWVYIELIEIDGYEDFLTDFTIDYIKTFKLHDVIGIEEFINIPFVNNEFKSFIEYGFIKLKEPVIMKMEIKSIEQLKQFKGLISEEHYWEMMAKVK